MLEHWSSPNGCHEDCPACAAEIHKCDNCDTCYQEDELINPIRHLEQRMTPGGVVPSGECPDEDCGALCYPITKKKDPWLDNEIQFPRLIAEAQVAGCFTTEHVKEMAAYMELTVEQV